EEAAGRDRRLLAALLEGRGPREGPKYKAGKGGQVTELAEPSAEEQFAGAFRAWGLDVDAIPTAEAAARLGARPGAVGTAGGAGRGGEGGAAGPAAAGLAPAGHPGGGAGPPRVGGRAARAPAPRRPGARPRQAAAAGVPDGRRDGAGAQAAEPGAGPEPGGGP